MANVEDIYLKVGVDTTGFNDSIKGMMKEIKGLKGAVGNSILSPEEQKLVLTRMAKLKDEIRDIAEGTNKVKGFELLARSVGGIAGGIGAITGSLKLLGVESKNAEKMQTILTTAMSASLAIQQLIELQNLKTAITTKAQAAATGIATAAQWLWNVAMEANPIGLIVIAIAAFVAGLALLTSWLIKSAKNAELAAAENIKLLLSYAKMGDAYDANQKRIKELDDKRSEREKEYAKEDLRFTIEREDAKATYIIAKAQLVAKMKRAIEDGDIAAQENLEFQKQSLVETTNNETKKRNERHQKEIGAINDKYNKIYGDAAKKSSEEAAKKAEEEDKKKWDAMIAAGEKAGQEYDRLMKEQEATDKASYEARKKAGVLSQEEILKQEEINFRKSLDGTNLSIAEKNAAWAQYYKTALDESVKFGKKLTEAEAEEFTPEFKMPTYDFKGMINQIKALGRDTKDVLDGAFKTDSLKGYESALAELKSKLEAIKLDPSMTGEAKAKLITETEDAMDQVKGKITEKNQEITTAIVDVVNGAAQAATMFIDASLEQSAAATEKALNNIQTAYEGETKNLDKLLKNKQISEAEYNRRKEKLDKEKAAKEKELKTEQAKKEKNAAIIKAIINTAVGVTGSLAQGGVLGIVMAAITGVLGAIEIALIASKPVPEFKKGGLVRNYANGGYLDGPSHTQGGIPINAEGGEFIVNKSTVSKPGMLNKLNNINNNQPSQPTIAVIDEQSISNVVGKVTSIPVNVVETDMTRSQRKVGVIEANASW